MGCANSKRSRCRHCRRPTSPHTSTSSSTMDVHQPVQIKSKNHHLVSLASPAMNSLKLNPQNQNQNQKNTQSNNHDQKENCKLDDSSKNHNNGSDFLDELKLEEKYSNTITYKNIGKIVPKTPTRTPPGEPENINTWELMDGLDEDNLVLENCFSFHTAFNSKSLDLSDPRYQENDIESPKPLWLDLSTNESSTYSANSIIYDFDPEIISTFRKALEELSPRTSFKLRSSGTTTPSKLRSSGTTTPSQLRSSGTTSPCNNDNMLFIKEPPMETTKKVTIEVAEAECPPFGHDNVVLYFTSLRGVRKTYEDCCYVRMVLKDSGVRIDERDVSMHHGFREELIELLGDGFRGKLPRVFVKGLYIGGTEEVRQMHEDGNLEKVLEGCEVGEDGICDMCGDIRFVPCESCSGSCKIYCEDDSEGIGNGGFQLCPYCNENGIIRCPICC